MSRLSQVSSSWELHCRLQKKERADATEDSEDKDGDAGLEAHDVLGNMGKGASTFLLEQSILSAVRPDMIDDFTILNDLERLE